MRPRVVVHIGARLDGRIDHVHVDIGLYYSLVPRWKEDITLSGSATCTSVDHSPDPEGLTLPPVAPDRDDPRATLVAVDSRGIVRNRRSCAPRATGRISPRCARAPRRQSTSPTSSESACAR